MRRSTPRAAIALAVARLEAERRRILLASSLLLLPLLLLLIGPW